MLFKYLMATVALAASAMGSPTDSTMTVAKPADTLTKCQTAIVEVKEPVVASCNEGKVEKVKSHLTKVQQPIQALSISFNYTSSVTIQKEVVTKYSYEFIKVLIRFQAVLKVIYSHPKISAGCTEVYAKLDAHFDSICTVFYKKHGVEIYKMIHEESTLDITVWEKSGFKFQNKGSYSAIGH